MYYQTVYQFIIHYLSLITQSLIRITLIKNRLLTQNGNKCMLLFLKLNITYHYTVDNSYKQHGLRFNCPLFMATEEEKQSTLTS